MTEPTTDGARALDSADSKPRRWTGWAVVVVAVAVLAVLAQTTPGRAALRSVGVGRPTTGFSTLSFTQPGTLPTVVASASVSARTASSTQRVSFGVANETRAARTYTWTIVERSHGVNRRLAAGTTPPVPAAGRRTISRDLTVRCAGSPSGNGGRTQVVVRLTTPAESISYWTSCREPAA